MFVTTIS